MGSPTLLRRETGRKEGVERVKKFRVIMTLLLSPLILLVGNGTNHSETLSATGRLGFQSSTVKICSGHRLGVCTPSPDLEME